MKRYWSILSIVFIFCLLFQPLAPIALEASAMSPAKTKLYVSPTGDDTIGTGTKEKPFQTIHFAQKVMREQKPKKMEQDFEIILQDGTHFLDEPIILTSEDSGTENYSVVFRAEHGGNPTISGGFVVENWSLHDKGNNVYKAQVPEEFDTRQLYVDGERKTRARSEEYPKGFSKIDRWKSFRAPLTGFYSTMKSWNNPQDIELFVPWSWKQTRLALKNINGRYLEVADNSWTFAYTQEDFSGSTIRYIENAYELLDEPGEWYLDKSNHMLYYIPEPGQPMNTVEVIAPRLETLLEGQGTSQAPLQNIKVQGITFAHNTWLLPNSDWGYPDYQAGTIYYGTLDTWEKDNWWDQSYQTPAGVTFEYTSNSTVSDCSFQQMGNAGLSFGRGCKNNTITYNHFKDLSGNGISLGNVQWADHRGVPKDSIVEGNEISHNTISNIGVEYYDNVGIFVGYAKDTNIHHNTLYDLPYTAISVGWGWGYTDKYQQPISQNNTISHNLMHDFMQETFDRGGIYTLGSQRGTKIYNNYMYNSGNANFLLYRDNGCVGFYDTNNVLSSKGNATDVWYYTANNPYPPYLTADNVATHNYYPAHMKTVGVGERNNLEINNIPVSDDAWDGRALAIIENAGVGGGEGPEPPEEGFTSKNIASRGVASASSYYDDQQTADKAIDGDNTTRWAAKSGATEDEWLQLDLVDNYYIETVTLSLYEHVSKRFQYEVQYSLDGESWETFFHQEEYTSTLLNSHTVDTSVLARYVRIYFLETDGNGCSIFELDVRGEKAEQSQKNNLALKAVATASSQYNSHQHPSNANDGNDSTRWSAASGKTEDEWLQLTFEQVENIQEVEILFYQHVSPRFQYRLEYTLDEENWQVFHEQDEYTQELLNSHLVEETVAAKAIRIYFTDTDGNGCSLYELAAY